MLEATTPDVYESAKQTVASLSRSLPSQLNSPKIAIICGSGLGGLADSIQAEPRHEVAYKDIPDFPKSTVQGHAGKLVFGMLGQSRVPAVLMMGRAHFYEGHSIAEVTFPVRVLKLLGVETIIVTNAAGGLNSDYAVGDIVVINDHLNLAGLSGFHPLRGPNAEQFGTRFPALSDAYDLELRRNAHHSWKSLKASSGRRRLHEGIYAFVGGPTYETRAESRMLRAMGADLVGMSTVPEIIVARHCDMRVFALSLVTNNVVLDQVPRGDDPRVEEVTERALQEVMAGGKANHEEVLEAGREAAKDVQALILQLVENLHSKHQ